eukprot:gene5508-6862_t
MYILDNIGVLDNKPFKLQSIKLGDTVEFQSFNIISIYDQPNLNNPINRLPLEIQPIVDQLCLVSNKIIIDKLKAGYMFREEPAFLNDSGWRVFNGDESDEYMDNRQNFQTVSMAAVLNVDDSFLHLLPSPIDSVFELDYDKRSNNLIWKQCIIE